MQVFFWQEIWGWVFGTNTWTPVDPLTNFWGVQIPVTPLVDTPMDAYNGIGYIARSQRETGRGRDCCDRICSGRLDLAVYSILHPHPFFSVAEILNHERPAAATATAFACAERRRRTAMTSADGRTDRRMDDRKPVPATLRCLASPPFVRFWLTETEIISSSWIVVEQDKIRQKTGFDLGTLIEGAMPVLPSRHPSGRNIAANCAEEEDDQRHLERDPENEMWTAECKYSIRRIEVAAQKRTVCGLSSVGSDTDLIIKIIISEHWKIDHWKWHIFKFFAYMLLKSIWYKSAEWQLWYAVGATHFGRIHILFACNICIALLLAASILYTMNTLLIIFQFRNVHPCALRLIVPTLTVFSPAFPEPQY